jgi:hypothetical protein
MNTFTKCLFGGALLGAGLTNPAVASTIGIDGILFQSSSVSGYDFGSVAYSNGPTSIDTFDFTVLNDGWVQLDILSYDIFTNFIDSELFLFTKNGNSLESGNLITFNSASSGFDLNGSSSSLDSFINIFLTTGEYTVAVASFSTQIAEIAGGVSSNGRVYDGGGNGLPTQGQYHLDITGNVVTVVPLPPAALAGLGLLAGMGAYRRIRK